MLATLDQVALEVKIKPTLNMTCNLSFSGFRAGSNLLTMTNMKSFLNRVMCFEVQLVVYHLLIDCNRI